MARFNRRRGRQGRRSSFKSRGRRTKTSRYYNVSRGGIRL